MLPDQSSSPDAFARLSTPKKIRVLFVDHTAVLGGGELALLSLLRELDRTAFEPCVLLLSDGPMVQELHGVAETHVLAMPAALLQARRDELSGVVALWRAGVTSLKYFHRLSRLLRQLSPRIVHTNSLKADLLAGSWAKWHRVPQIWHIRDRVTEDYLPRGLARLFRTFCALVPNGLIANSRSTLESLRLPSRKIAVVISSGLDLTPYVSAADRSRSFAAALKEGATVQIGIIGRICPWKGQDIFLRAAASVRTDYPRAHFHLVGAPLFGEQAFEQELRELTESLGLQDCTTFAGFQRDVPSYMRRLDLIVHASTIPEPFGQVIVQGMASRKPVIATEGGGPSEILEDGVTGFLVPRKDAQKLASTILMLLRRPEFAEEVATRAQQTALGRYGVAESTRAVEALYRRLLKAGTEPTL